MFFPELASGTEVRFRMSDVVCPDQREIIQNITQGLYMTGKVVLLSDAGERRKHFAVIEVAGVASPLIIPVEKIESWTMIAR